MPFSKLTKAAALIAVLGLVACQSIPSYPGIETTIENEWHPGSVGVVDYPYGPDPSYDSVAKGDGVFVRLYHSVFEKGSWDGHSYHEITFQLPSSVHEGASYQLVPMPPGKALDDPSRTASTNMRPGDLLGMVFGNPFSGWLEEAKKAEVTVLSITEKTVQIHLRLKADLQSYQVNEPPIFTFDIDDDFELEIVRPR